MGSLSHASLIFWWLPWSSVARPCIILLSASIFEWHSLSVPVFLSKSAPSYKAILIQ